MNDYNKAQTVYCKWCNKECHSRNSLLNHEARCPSNPDRRAVGAGGFMKGKTPWNKGLTKDTNSKVAEIAKKVSISMVGHSTGVGATPEKEAERRKKISDYAKSSGLGGYVHGSGRGKKGRYKGFFCDSTYELVYIIYNLDNNIEFKRCDRTYPYQYEGMLHYYHPDFELADGSLVEIKGYHTQLVDVKVASVNDRPIKVLYENDLLYAFKWVSEHYTYDDITDLYE